MSIEEAAAKLQEEISCSICLECFRDPVSIHCGHNFCRECITKYWKIAKKKSFCCPHCRNKSQKKVLKPNNKLKSIAEIAPKLNAKVAGGENHMCKKHLEPLKLFCKDDQMLVCVVCDKSMDHQDHTVIPKDEHCKEQLHDLLKGMKQEKEMLLGFKALGAARSQQFQKTIDSEMQKTGATFQQSLQFLDEQRQLLLTQWQTLQAAAANRQAEETVKLSEAIAQLDGLITEAEGRSESPSTEFLQKVKSTLNRFKKRKFQELMELPSELEETMNSLSRKNTIAAVTLQKIEGTLSSQLEKGQWESPAGGDTTINPDATTFFEENYLSAQYPKRRGLCFAEMRSISSLNFHPSLVILCPISKPRYHIVQQKYHQFIHSAALVTQS